MEKKKTVIVIGIVSVVFVLLLVLGWNNVSGIITAKSGKQQIPGIIADEKGINNKQDWDLFVNNSQNKETADIQIKYQYKENLSGDSVDMAGQDEVSLRFDGKNYCYSSGSLNEKYKYLLELTGRFKNATNDTTIVILSNEEYSFGQIEKSIYSSNSNDHIPYKLLFFY